MRRRIALLLTAGALAAPAAAQEFDLSPARELARYEKLVGNWTGEGTYRTGAEGEATPWTSKSTVKKILGGHFFQEDMGIEMGEGMPPLVFRSILGWDRARQKPFVFTVSNMGQGGPLETRWVDDHTMTSVKWTMDQGMPLCARDISRMEDDSITFEMYEARGAEPFHLHVEGKSTRGGDGFDASTVNEPIVMPGQTLPGEREMQRLARIQGDYTLKGKVMPMPGMPMITFTGRESMQPMLGGTTLQFHGKSDPDESGMSWEGLGFMIWDPVRDCYLSAHADNMGMCGVSESYFIDDQHVVMTTESLDFGTPSVSRTVLELDAEGRCQRVTVDTLAGTSPAARTFDTSYTLASGASDGSSGKGRAGAPSDAASGAPAAKTAPAFRSGSCCDKAQKAGNACAHPCCVTASGKGEVCAKCN